MKFKYLFLFALLYSSILYAQEVNSDSPGSSQSKKILRGLIVGIRCGVKLPEKRTGAGPWGGLYVNMPTGKGWSLQLEYNIWVAERDLRADMYAPEWTMLVAYKLNFKTTYIRMLCGIGGISSGESWFGSNRDFLLVKESYQKLKSFREAKQCYSYHSNKYCFLQSTPNFSNNSRYSSLKVFLR